MDNALGEDLPVGVYRSDDNIKNLRIRVKIRKIVNACFQGRDGLNFRDPNELELVTLMNVSSTDIERVFTWQENTTYKHENNSKLAVKNGKEGSESDNIALISYSDIKDSNWKSERFSTHPVSQSNHLEKLMSNTTLRRITMYSNEHETWQKPLFLDTKQFVISQTFHKRQSHLPISQSMVIIARLNYEDSPSEEVELCYLHIDSHGVLSVIPDFCKDEAFTFLNSRSEVYEYTLENVSNCIQRMEAEKEKNFVKKMEYHRKKIMKNSIGDGFLIPSPNTLLCCINGEIVSATNFMSQDIFVRYCLELPKGGILSNDILEGVTQTCRSKKKHKDAVTYFGYIFSQNLEFDSEILTCNLMPKLHIIVEVTSVDKWGNFRNEGYGYCEIPLKPGVHVSEIDTWKLRPTTLANKLRHYFIGGTPCLEDLAYVRIPSDAKESELSKYGLRAETSGTVTVRCFIIMHSRPSAS